MNRNGSYCRITHKSDKLLLYYGNSTLFAVIMASAYGDNTRTPHAETSCTTWGCDWSTSCRGLLRPVSKSAKNTSLAYD